MANVKLTGVFKSFGNNSQTIAVNDVNLDITHGEFIVVVGPSGCGKTTTLRMIAGLETPDLGDIEIDGERVNDVHPSLRDIAMVFQNYALYPHMSVFDNLAYGLKRRGVPKNEIRRMVAETALFLQMDNLLQRKPAQLSGGQRQRVALGRAIVRKPRLFLMDEPLSNLDTKLRVETRNEILRLHQELKVTTIYVTHDQGEAMTMGDRIVIMNAGKIQQQGAPLDLYSKPINLFVAGFLGTPAMNLILGEIRAIESKMVFRSSIFELPVEDKLFSLAGNSVQVGIRPQHLQGRKLNSSPSDEALQSLCKARILFIEHLGSQAFASVIVNEAYLFCEVDAEERFLPQEEVNLFSKRSSFHFFDSISGLRIDELDH